MCILDKINVLITSGKTDCYLHTPIPSPIDDEVRELLDTVFVAEPHVRESIISKMKLRHGQLVDAFATRMASYAVRTGDGLYVHLALVASAVAYDLVGDFRDLTPLNVPFDAALRIGLDPHNAFDRATAFDPKFHQLAIEFLERDEVGRSLTRSGYFTLTDKAGFRYVTF